MNKKLPLMAVILALGAVGTSGCSFLKDLLGKNNDEPKSLSIATTGGTDQDKQAIKTAINMSIVAENATTKLVTTQKNVLTAKGESEGGYSYVHLTTKQVVQIERKNYTVELGYTYARNNYLLADWDFNASHKRLEFNYPKKGQQAVDYVISLTSVKCNDCTNSSGSKIDFTLSLQPDEVEYDDYSIAELMAISNRTKAGSTIEGFTKVNYDVDYSAGKHAYYQSNHSQKYLFVRTWGEVVYYAPDGNFALIADGDNYMELFAGSGEGKALNPSEHKDLEVGNRVLVSGSMSAYMGNMQMSYVSRVVKITDSSSYPVTSPTAPAEYTATVASKYNFNDTLQYQVKGGETLMNKMMFVQGTYVAGSLKQESTSKTSISSDRKRYTFEMQLLSGGKITIAYDYHTNYESKSDFVDKNLTALNKIFSDSSKTYKIAGSMRYAIYGLSSAESKTADNFHGTNGTWQLVPLTADQITVVA